MSGMSPRKKRSKFAVLLLSPILVGTFMLGWTLYVLGEPGQPKRRLAQKQVNEPLTNLADRRGIYDSSRRKTCGSKLIFECAFWVLFL